MNVDILFLFLLFQLCHESRCLNVVKVRPGKWCGSANEIKTVYNPPEGEEVPDEDCQIVVMTNKSDVVPIKVEDPGKPSKTRRTIIIEEV